LGYEDEGVGLIVRVLSLQDFQPLWSWSTNVTDGHRQKDGRHAISMPRYALVHRAVKTDINKKLSYRRKTARQLPTWRGARPSSPLPRRPLSLHLCVWSNPKPTTNVRQACRPL